MLLRKVVTLQRRSKLIPQNSSVLIAFSGGIDSVALSLALMELRDFLKIKRLALAHINHGIRKEANKDEAFAYQFAKRHNLEIFVERFSLKKRAKELKENLEKFAREVRYNALREIKEREGFDLIATAHHLNDLVETVILWLTRGSGMEGLLGFEEKTEDIVRPLYLVSREEIKEYVLSKGESWVEDRTNYQLRYARNRIRHKVVPELKKINPALENTVLRLREILREEDHFLSLEAIKTLEICKEGEKLKRKCLLSQHKAIQRRVLSLWLSVRDFEKIEQAVRLLKRCGSMLLGDGRILVVEREYLYLKSLET